MLSFWEEHKHVIDIVNISVFITVVAMFGNLLTVIAKLKFKHLQTKSNILTLSLSCSDVVCVLYWSILEVTNVTLNNENKSKAIYLATYDKCNIAMKKLFFVWL